jgi:hypothetical protein
MRGASISILPVVVVALVVQAASLRGVGCECFKAAGDRVRGVGDDNTRFRR